MFRLLWILPLAVLAPLNAAAAEPVYDVVVYGGTSAGVAAAVQVSRMGKTVVLIEPGRHLGGLTTSGLGWTDSGNKAVIGGISREFYRRVKKHYDDENVWTRQSRAGYPQYRAADDAMWTFEPQVAEGIMLALIKEHRVPVVYGQRLDLSGGVKKEGPRIVEIAMESGQTFRGRMFVDATYEGDLMAKAGVSYFVGREANSQYGETLNGVEKARAVSHQFNRPVDPYVVPGDPKSGLLPGINDMPGEDGQADRRMQAYNYRVCMTDSTENRVPFEKPPGYDPLEHELLLRNFEAGDLRLPLKIDMMPNRKTDLNNNHAVSTDYIGRNYNYADGDYATREKILQVHQTYIRGFLWTLANHPRVPESIRAQAGRWGLSKDEFADNNHWPYTAYIREARRMVADYVQTEHDCRRGRVAEDSVGLGSYNMDSHNCQRYVTAEGHVRNEGDIQVSPGGPYLISYRAIVPKQAECANLLVPVCLSSSHIAYGSIRMEPVFMILGQSAATAACQALDAGIAVQEVPYDKLRERLLADHQVLDLPAGTAGPKSDVGVSPDSLEGIVIDDTQAKKTGDWLSSNSQPGFVGGGYLHDNAQGQGEKSINFPISVKTAGKYEVRLAYTPYANRATNVPVTIRHADGQARITIDQRRAPSIKGMFVSLGTFRFETQGGEVVVSNDEAKGYVVADAVQLIEAK